MFWKSLSFCSRVFLATWVRWKTLARLDLGIVGDVCGKIKIEERIGVAAVVLVDLVR